jgi:syntaxin 16
MRVKAEGSGDLTPAEITIRNNIQRSAARKLQNLSMAFRSSQKDYLRRLRGQKEGGEDFEFLKEEERTSTRGGLAAGGVDQVQLAVLEDTEMYVQERDTEIRNIVRNIEELGTIFKELAVLVIDQGTVLDRIDFNMEQVVEHTAEGVSQLRQAEEKQKSAMPIKCIALLLILIAIMIVILVLKHT